MPPIYEESGLVGVIVEPGGRADVVSAGLPCGLERGESDLRPKIHCFEELYIFVCEKLSPIAYWLKPEGHSQRPLAEENFLSRKSHRKPNDQ